jgi:nucleoside-diphosphate-sugar epimerase
VVRDCRPEVVYHLAAAGVAPGQRHRAHVLATNVLGTAHLLDALAGWDCRLVQVGTSWEYGTYPGRIDAETPPRPRDDYAVSKAAVTMLCQSDAARGRNIVTVRIFMAYGPGEDPARLVPYVMGCCLRGETARVSHGMQRRDFIHVDDVTELLNIAGRHRGVVGQVLHAGTGRAVTVRAAVETILTICGDGRAEFGAVPVRPDDPVSNVADITRTTALTGWRPRVGLRDGVAWLWAALQEAARGRAA